jgi:hypothetical protein
MANTFELIASSTVGAGGAASIDFTSIPSTYTDLVLKISVRGDNTSLNDLSLQYNGDTGSSYSYLELGGTGAATFSGSGSGTKNNTLLTGSSSTASTFVNHEIYIPNYAGSNQKSISVDAVTENNSASTNVQMRLQAWKWSGTAAITSIKLYSTGFNFVQYSTAYLFGIKSS